jgi:hypothetical protein
MFNTYHLRMLKVNLFQYLEVHALCINRDEIKVLNRGVR